MLSGQLLTPYQQHQLYQSHSDIEAVGSCRDTDTPLDTAPAPAFCPGSLKTEYNTSLFRDDRHTTGIGTPRDRVMSQSLFGESNPFGGGGNPGRAGRHGGASFQRIAEEEDDAVSSPTDPSFHASESRRGGAPPSSASAGQGGSPERGFGSFNTNPFGSDLLGGGNPGQGQGEEEGSGSSLGGLNPGGNTDNGGYPSNYGMGRRTSVSAESLHPTSSGTDSWVPPYHEKSLQQLSRLQSAVSANFLFSHLDDEQFETVLNALVEKPVPAKDIKVIVQGDAGDYFYVVENGHFNIHIHPSGAAQPGPDGLGTKVNSIGPGGSFGELALMYNAPRAATVISTEPSMLWGLDRITFRRILMDSAFQRRRMYEAFLEEVPLLSSLKTYERSKIADALESIKHPAGAVIIKEGDPGNSFYLLEVGEAEAYKDGIDGPVKHYTRGDYFGELALLDDKPRAASVVAKTDVKIAQLGRDGFKRLLGPVEDIMRRADYGTNSLPKKET